MEVEQNGLGLKAQRGVSEVNNSWWFLEKFGYRTWCGPFLKIVFLMNWSESQEADMRQVQAKKQTKPKKRNQNPNNNKNPTANTQAQTLSSELLTTRTSLWVWYC